MRKVFKAADVSIVEAKVTSEADILCNHCRVEYQLTPNDNVKGYLNPNAKPSWDNNRTSIYTRAKVIWPGLVLNSKRILQDLQCLYCHSVGDFNILPYGMLDFETIIASLRDRCHTCDKNLKESGGLIRSLIDQKLYCLECVASTEEEEAEYDGII